MSSGYRRNLLRYKRQQKTKVGLNLDKIWNTYYEFTGLTSNVSRQLNFAGIAIVWLFVEETDNGICLKMSLIIGLLCFVLSFWFDLAQYLYLSILHFLEARKLEKSGQYDTQVLLNDRLIGFANVFFFGKIIFTLAAYCWIATFFVMHLGADNDLHPAGKKVSCQASKVQQQLQLPSKVKRQ